MENSIPSFKSIDQYLDIKRIMLHKTQHAPHMPTNFTLFFHGRPFYKEPFICFESARDGINNPYYYIGPDYGAGHVVSNATMPVIVETMFLFISVITSELTGYQSHAVL